MLICRGVERRGKSMTEGAFCPGPQTKGGGGGQKHDRSKKRVPLGLWSGIKVFLRASKIVPASLLICELK